MHPIGACGSISSFCHSPSIFSLIIMGLSPHALIPSAMCCSSWKLAPRFLSFTVLRNISTSIDQPLCCSVTHLFGCELSVGQAVEQRSRVFVPGRLYLGHIVFRHRI